MCNLDCFNCPYKDCVNDNITHKEMREIDNFDKEITYEQADGHKKKLRKMRGYDKRYYQKNRETIIAKQRDNSECHKQYSREYYQRNAEKERQRKRESYWRKKAEAVS